jgi:hypothetical protein
MFVTTPSTLNNNHPPSYIIAAPTNTTTNGGIEPTNNNTPQILSDIKLICIQRKKVCWNSFDFERIFCFSREVNVIFI